MSTYLYCYFFIRVLSPLLFMRLLSNQLNEDFEASSSEDIKLSISLAVAYGVLYSVLRVILQNF